MIWIIGQQITHNTMFSKETYIRRRAELKRLVKSGIIILFGNNDSPANFPNNGYYPFRQDSTFLYYFGQQRDGLVGVIDLDEDKETLIGNDIDIEDIVVWLGRHRGRHGCTGGRGTLGSDERAQDHLQRCTEPEAPHPLPASLQI